MGRRMNEQDWQFVDSMETFDHVAAHMVAEEFVWSWATCWFVSTGEFNHSVMNPRNGSYAEAMDRALFGWWADVDDEDFRKSPRQQRARERMLAYLRDREARGDMGPVDGFKALWRQS